MSSVIRSRSGSPTERTDTKKRSVEPPFGKFTFLEDYPSPIDKLYTYGGAGQTPITSLFTESSIRVLAVEILANSNSDEVFNMTLSCVNHLLEFLDDGFTISSQYLDKLNTMVREVWENPHFAQCLGATIEKNPVPIALILCYANEDTPALRIARMEADPSFKPCLKGITSATKKTILRLFFSILFGHWADKGELTKLDKRMEKDYFGQRMALIANHTPIVAFEELNDVENDFLYDIEEASQAKDMEPFREWLVSKYGTHGDIDAIIEEVKTDVSNFLDICQKPMNPRYNGKKAKMRISMTNGEYVGLSMQTYK